MKKAALLVVWLVVAACGCEQRPTGLPGSIAQYDQMRSGGSASYPDTTILMVNRQRMLDVDLPPGQRAEAMALVNKLGPGDPESQAEFAEILANPATPGAVRSAAIDLLTARDDPRLAGPLAMSMPQLKGDPAARAKVLEWLGRHSSKAVIAELVKMWWTRPAGAQDAQFEELLGRMGGASWDQVLLGELNSPEFGAAGEAAAILSSRLGPVEMSGKVARMAPQTDAIRCLQAFFGGVDFVPATPAEFEVVLGLYQKHAAGWAQMTAAYRRWLEDGYKFELRDVHLMAGLGGDSRRPALRRAELVGQLKASQDSREHAPVKLVATTGRAASGPGVASVRLDANVDRLSVADLWNIYLLEEMLSRARIQAALRSAAQQDREDKTQAWGGLVFYKDGGADAMIYKGSVDGGENDLIYVPPAKALNDVRDAMCMFVMHFEAENNMGRAGPTQEELRASKEGNYSGLVLTSVNAGSFVAYYYNPRGAVVSLGLFPFQEWK